MIGNEFKFIFLNKANNGKYIDTGHLVVVLFITRECAPHLTAWSFFVEEILLLPNCRKGLRYVLVVCILFKHYLLGNISTVMLFRLHYYGAS